MECRKIEITVVSADNLPDVRNLGHMKVYAEVSLNGEPETCQKTNFDRKEKTNPGWNFPFKYTISESAVWQPGLNLVVKLFCRRTLGDRLIGEVKIPVKSLFDMGIRSENILSYPVAGTRNGKLNISYSFGEKFWPQNDGGSETLGAKHSAWKAAGLGVGLLLRGTWFFITGDLGQFDFFN